MVTVTHTETFIHHRVWPVVIPTCVYTIRGFFHMTMAFVHDHGRALDEA